MSSLLIYLNLIGAVSSTFAENSSCELTVLAQASLESFSTEETRDGFTEAASSLEKQIKNEPDRKVRRTLRALVRDLQDASQSSDPKERLVQSLNDYCEAEKKFGGSLPRGVSLTSAAIVSSIGLPLKWLKNLGMSTFTRPLVQNDELVEKERPGNRTFSWIQTIYQSARVTFFSGNSYLLAVFGANVLDLELGHFCRSTISKTKAAQKSCEDYQKIKAFEKRASLTGSTVGSGLRKKMLHTFDFRGDDHLNETLCKKSPRHQVRIAMRARERLPLTSRIVLPTSKTCVKIEILDEGTTPIPQWIDGIVLIPTKKTEWNEKKQQFSTPPAPTDEELCDQAYLAQGMRKLNLQAMANRQSLQLRNSREVELQFKTVNGDLSPYAPTSFKKVIAIIAPHSTILAQKDATEVEYESLSQFIRTETSKLKKLRNSKSIQSCLSLQKKNPFHWDKLVEAKQRISKLSMHAKVQEYRMIQSQLKRLHSHWETLEIHSLNELKKIIAHPEVRDLVIIAHGEFLDQNSGKIVDADLNELPWNGFETISSNLQSISLFSCGAEKSLSTYEIEKLLAHGNHTWPSRIVAWADSRGIYKTHNQVPVPALKDFIEQLDEKLEATTRENLARSVALAQRNLPQKASSSQHCEVNFNDSAVSKGVFAVYLNEHWLGMISDITQDPTRNFDFPCEWLNESPRQIFLQNVNINFHSSLSPDITLKLNSNENQWPPHFYYRKDENHSIRSAHFELN